MADERHRLYGQISALIEQLADGQRDDLARDRLLAEVCAYQAAQVEPYGRLLPHWVAPSGGAGPAFPALPTDVFRYVRVASFPPQQQVRAFRTSGTTHGMRGTHPFADLSLYDQAARTAARCALFPDVERMRLLLLAPDEAQVPDSSLSYMLSRFLEWFGGPGSAVLWTDGGLSLPRLVRALRAAEVEGVPVALLGTSFAFVHAEDGLADERFALPAGSRLMQTGGYKGRSREVEPDTLRRLLAARYGLAEAQVIQEYGMTELSSQMYSPWLRESQLRTIEAQSMCATTVDGQRLWVPGWVRVQAVEPETLQPLPAGQLGLLRIDDLANLDSVCAIQTADLARVEAGELWLLGRSPEAMPRGCSLAVEEALS